MPKFNGQNKKKIDPRYFLEETTDRDEPPWGSGGKPASGGDPAARATSLAMAGMRAQPPWGGGGQPASGGDPAARATDLAMAGMKSQIDKDGDSDDAAELLDITKDMLISQIRQGSKDLYNLRNASGYPEDLERMSIDQLEDILFDQGASPEQRAIDDAYRDEDEAKMGVDSPEDRMPKRQGFGRRPSRDQRSE